ncbi:hypothetical protein H6P81_003962 [Aristolochia fimbriata]|uniref:Pectinesterase inhibitor domain-containing protein n=1 Tax=Aristolochia fimbriata TaxID=158543 RepID=A0AAV7FFX2_ARIFI|nr:hypothetical protein H6P81_003962 [Aristolochia fimbriata]
MSSVLLRRLAPCLLLLLLLPLFVFCEETEKECHPGPGEDSVEAECRDTRNYDLCYKTLMADPDALRACAVDMSPPAVNILLKNVTGTSKHTLRLIQETTDPTTRECLYACNKLYKNVIHDLKVAVEAAKVYETLDVAEAAAINTGDNATECENVFKKRRIASPLTPWNHMLIELSGVVDDIISYALV